MLEKGQAAEIVDRIDLRRAQMRGATWSVEADLEERGPRSRIVRELMMRVGARDGR